MPKMKSHSGTKKRFRVTGSGKLMRAKAYKSHILTKKTTKRKRLPPGDRDLQRRSQDRRFASRLIPLRSVFSELVGVDQLWHV